MLKRAAILIACVTGLTATAWSGTFTVTSLTDAHDSQPGNGVCDVYELADTADCTLRAAIEEAVTSEGADTILIPYDSLPVVITLGPLVIDADSVAIIGDNQTSIDGAHNLPYSDLFELSSDYCTISGLTIKRSRNNGIQITGKNNLIGGDSPATRNIFISNGIDNEQAAAILITGTEATDNNVTGNFVGVYGNGTLVYGNANGIRIDFMASANTIGGSSPPEANIISGNLGYGVVLTQNCNENFVSGNIIGLDISATAELGNALSGVLISEGAHDNYIGGQDSTYRNIVSANLRHGIEITGSNTVENHVDANFIGTDTLGRFSRGNRGSGVILSNGANNNHIGWLSYEQRNIISGNYRDGVSITGSGTSHNIVTGNFIGTGQAGDRYLGNGMLPGIEGHGVHISEGAHDNAIGGTFYQTGNVISGQLVYYGIYIEGAGTRDNHIKGNKIGTDLNGEYTIANGSGVVIRHGANHNYIGGENPDEGNLISGNRADFFPFSAGVILYDPGTNDNKVLGNKIGPDITGTRALYNGEAGVIIGNGASYNTIGGATPVERNIISGNGSTTMLVDIGRGVHIFGEGTDHNAILGNFIGLTPDSEDVLPNRGHGIAVTMGAKYNTIGVTDDTPAPNAITGNLWHGVYIADVDTKYNTVRYNAIYANDSLGIVIADSANGDLPLPTLTLAATGSVTGYGAPSFATVDIYLSDNDPSGYGEGRKWLGSGTADETGAFEVFISGAQINDTITAVITDMNGNSSSFSQNKVITVVTSVAETVNDLIPDNFALEQNYPNPFNPTTTIGYSLPQGSKVELAVYNILGQKVVTLFDEYQSAGQYEITWDGRDGIGRSLASGVYYYQLRTENFLESRKMILLK